MKWSRTKDELKEKVITSKINQPDKTLREIGEETWLPKSTISDIINNDFKKYLEDNLEEAEKYYNKLNAKFDWNKLNNLLELDNDIFQEYCEYIWNYKEVKDNLEWFMLQSIWKWIIRRKNINQITRYWIFEKAWFKCQCCWMKPNKDNNIELHIDHIIPFSMGWLDVIENYQVLCKSCNSSKWNNYNIRH